MANNLKKIDIIKNLSKETGFSLNFSKKLINDLSDLIVQNIKSNNFSLKNLGSFKIIDKKERIGRNPKTKVSYVISARKSLKFITSKNILENLNTIKKPPLSSNISLGIIPTISPYFLPIILPGLKRNFPNLRLTISESQSAELISKVKSGIIDIAILALPYDLEGMNAYKFWEEDFYYIHHKNRFSSEKKRIRAKDLDTRELMLLKDGHCLKDHALAACNISKNSNNYQMAASNLNTLIELVAGDLGTTLVPEMAINQLLKTKQDLQKVLLNEPSPHRELAIIARPTYPLIENINLLRNFFEEELKKTHN